MPPEQEGLSEREQRVLRQKQDGFRTPSPRKGAEDARGAEDYSRLAKGDPQPQSSRDLAANAERALEDKALAPSQRAEVKAGVDELLRVAETENESLPILDSRKGFEPADVRREGQPVVAPEVSPSPQQGPEQPMPEAEHPVQFMPAVTPEKELLEKTRENIENLNLSEMTEDQRKALADALRKEREKMAKAEPLMPDADSPVVQMPAVKPETSAKVERKENPDFSTAGSFDELYSMLREAGSVTGQSGKVYEGGALIDKIKEIERLSPDVVTHMKSFQRGKVFSVEGGLFNGLTYEGKLRETVVKILNEKYFSDVEPTPKPVPEGPKPRVVENPAISLPAGAKPIDKVPGIKIELPKIKVEKPTTAPATEKPKDNKKDEGVEWNEKIKRFGDYLKVRILAVSDPVREVLGQLYEKTDLDARIPNSVDRVKALFNDRVARWHGDQAAEYKRGIEKQEKIIVSAQKALEGETSAKRIQKLNWVINRAQGKADTERSKMRPHDESRALFESRRDDLCKRIVERIEIKLQPYDEKLAQLAEKKKALTTEIEALKSNRDDLAKKHKELEAAAKGMPLTVRISLHSQRGTLRRKTSEADKAMSKAKKEGFRIDKRARVARQKSDPWRNKKVEIERISKRQNKITK